MKIAPLSLLIALLVSSNGCMTYSAVQDSRGNANATLWLHGVGEDGPDDGQWHPQYYLLLPLTVPGDLVTSPIQLFMGAKLMFGDWHT
jgi:hypothetical protein